MASSLFVLDPLGFLPDELFCDVVVEQSGGKDERNNPRPIRKHIWKRVLLGARSTSDPLDYSDLVENRVMLYGHKPKDFVLGSTDVIIAPPTARAPGRWSVRGQPADWFVGLEVTLDRENAATDRPSRRA